MIFPSTEDPSPNSFDDFLNEDLFGIDDDGDDELFGNLDGFFDKASSGSGKGCKSSAGTPASNSQSPPQPWRKGLWCLNQAADPKDDFSIEKAPSKPKPSHQFVPRTFDSFNLVDDMPAFYQCSPAARSSFQPKTRFVSSSNPPKSIHSPYARPTFAREVTLSPTPMYAELQHSINMPGQEKWHQDFQNFHLRPSGNGVPLSPPAASQFSRHKQTLSANQSGTLHEMAPTLHDLGAVQRHGFIHGLPFGQLYSPSPEPGLIDPSFDAIGFDMASSPNDETTLSALHHPKARSSTVPRWVTESFSPPVNPTCVPRALLPKTSGSEYQAWISPPLLGSNRPAYVTNNLDSYPTAPAHKTSQQARATGVGGLGTQFTALDEGPFPGPKAHFSQTKPLKQAQLDMEAVSSYPPLPPPTHAFSQASPFSTPRHRKYAFLSPSPSPSLSPTNISRTLRYRSPTRSDYNHNRRKSIGGKHGPRVDTSIPVPSIPRTPKESRTPKTPRGERAGPVDFVNFTPRDSAKLMSDVAPSGSSKTRARREQEAREKRRRLSEAAVKAVKRAGGDLKSLERAILA